MNEEELEKLPGDTIEFVCVDQGIEPFLSEIKVKIIQVQQILTLKKTCPAAHTIKLKIGSQVLLLKNLDPKMA